LDNHVDDYSVKMLNRAYRDLDGIYEYIKLYPIDRTARKFKIHKIGHKEINKPLVTDTREF